MQGKKQESYQIFFLPHNEGLEQTSPLCKIATSIFPTMQDRMLPQYVGKETNHTKFYFFPTMKVWSGLPHYVRLQPASFPLCKILMLPQYVGKETKIILNFLSSPQ